MENHKSIQSKKFFKSLEIKNVLKNSNFVVFLNHVGFNVKDSLAFKKLLLNKYNLIFANVKNKPLVTLLSKTKHNSISSVFQGNSGIIYQNKNSLIGFEDSTIEDLFSNEEFKKLLFENSDIVPMGFLIYKNTFVTPELFKSLSIRRNDISGRTTTSLLANPSRSLVNNCLLRSSYDIMEVLAHKKNSNLA